MSSQERFGYEWEKYSALDPNYELQFQRWTAPLQPRDFSGKTVLDAGCGMGRNSYWALKYGAARVMAFDFDERSVEAARANLRDYVGRATVVYKSIYDIPWENEFDIVFSIGVIHHLENPAAAIANLVKATSAGGKILIWVYSFEGNEWIVQYINLLRKYLTSRLPVSVVHVMSLGLSVPLWVFVKTFPLSRPYLKQLSTFSFKHLHSIVFDQLIPKIAYYWTKTEALALMNLPELVNIEIHQPENRQGWTVVATKK